MAAECAGRRLKNRNANRARGNETCKPWGDREKPIRIM
ncbi:hypothetical protein B4135_1148 [Caldibacillus debilis]|uniref:Uncharacterized protein n=1 Tax=Caldibacillus debilis TaxID=301148 RepID=A0A150MEE7_9BACI|nr:hypothetical protein B4135_1148 [Caldibacillus debilis]